MNIHGQVCGYARNAANTSSRGFLWTDVNDNNIAELLEVVDLGHPITTNFFARALNDHGHVVGGLAFGSSRTAQIWDTVNGFRNLNDLIDPSLPYELRQAESINNAGQVTMYGRITGSTTEHVFILTPRVPPDQDFDGDVDADDFVAFDLCVSGATILVAPGCEASDFDQDGDADTTDFSLLQRCYSGENIPVDLTCDD
jgi:hypothetical protein